MRNAVSLWTRVLLGAAALMLASVTARAQFPGDHPDTIQFRLGGIFASLDNQTKVSAVTDAGNQIDFTGLGLTPDHKNTFKGEGYWNFLGKSYFDFGYVNFDVTGSKSISRDLIFNGYVYTAGAEVTAETRSRYIYGAFRYELVRNQAWHLGLSLGVTYTSMEATLSAAAGVRLPDGTVVQGGKSTSRSVNVPIPLLGVETEIALGKDFTIGGHFRAIGATVDPYSGSWIEWAGNLNWYFANNWGVGAAYEYQKLHFKKDPNQPNAFLFDQKYDGPRVYIIATF